MFGYILAVFSGILLPFIFFYIQQKQKTREKKENEIDISLYINKHKLDMMNTNELILGINNKLNSKDSIRFNLPITIKNNSNKTVKNINIFFIYGRKSPIAIDYNLESFKSLLDKKYILRKSINTETGIKTNYTIKYLNPKVALKIPEYLECNNSTTLAVETKSKKNKNYKSTIKLKHRFNIIISGDNFSPKSYSFHLRIEKSTSLKKLIKENFKILKTEHENRIKNMFDNFDEELKGLKINKYYDKISEDFILFYATLKKVDIKQSFFRNYYIAKVEDKNYSVISIKPKKNKSA